MKQVLFGAAALLAALCANAAAHAAPFAMPPEEPVCTARGQTVTFHGASEYLGACLDGAGLGTIAELRIGSRGGDAQQTLADMERYAGRIDLVIVDSFCASSCANYVLPAARRVRVPENAYVMLHGSIDVAQVRAYLDGQRPTLVAQGVPEGELDDLIARSLAPMEASARQQAGFEAARLSCADWLRPQDNLAAFAHPEAEGILVTESMARRCFKQTEIESFWSPTNVAQAPEAVRAGPMVLAQ